MFLHQASKFWANLGRVRSFSDEERGSTATEYGMLMSFLAMIVITGITLFGLELLGWYDELTAHLELVLGIP